MQRNTYTHTNIYTHVNANQWESNRFLWKRWRNARMQNPIRIWPPVLLMVPKCCWFTALSSGKQNTVLNAAIYLRKGGQAPLYSSPLTRQPLYSGKQEGKIQPDAGGCYCSWKSFFFTNSASVFSPVKRDHGYHVSCVAQLLAQKKRQSTNVCWTVAALRWLKACLLVLYRSFSLKFVSTFEKMLKLQLLNNRVVGRLSG